MHRRFFAEFLTVLSVKNVKEDEKNEFGSDECLIGDVFIKIKVTFRIAAEKLWTTNNKTST